MDNQIAYTIIRIGQPRKMVDAELNTKKRMLIKKSIVGIKCQMLFMVRCELSVRMQRKYKYSTGPKIQAAKPELRKIIWLHGVVSG